MIKMVKPQSLHLLFNTTRLHKQNLLSNFPHTSEKKVMTTLPRRKYPKMLTQLVKRIQLKMLHYQIFLLEQFQPYPKKDQLLITIIVQVDLSLQFKIMVSLLVKLI